MASMASNNTLVFGGDDRALSPIVGVILMVGITVMLAGVVGIYVMDVVDADREAPQAAFTAEEGENVNGIHELRFVHDNGDPVDADEVHLRGPGLEDISISSAVEAKDEQLAPGDKVIYEFYGAQPERGTEVRLVWDEGSDSRVLSRHIFRG